MDKRKFLKQSSLLLGANILMPMIACDSQTKGPVMFNWAGNLAYSTDQLESPDDQDTIIDLVRKHDRLKPLGTRHSFNRIADSKHRHLSLDQLKDDINISQDKKTVSFNAGIQYGILANKLQEQGYALHNLASLPHISVAGACATGTHGSGDQNGNLPSIVRAMEMITADGSLIRLSENENKEDFKGAIVGLGALGVITQLTLEIQPTFDVKQYVYEDLPLEQIQDHFDEIFSSGYSVSLFTDWRKNRINQLWIKEKVDPEKDAIVMEESYFGAVMAKNHLHPIKEISPVNCTEQMGMAGPWHERLPHFKMDFTPSSGEELQSEFFVPRENAVEAITALYAMGEAIFPHLLISEIRSIKSDDLWLSPAYGRESIALHFTWKQDWENVRKLLPKIERALLPFGVRPHWGKLFTFQYDYLNSQYEKMGDFQSLMKKYDPKGKFINDFLASNILGKG